MNTIDMGIGGLASGLDIDDMVDQLMEAERIPLKRLEQDRTELTWKQDAFRDINRSLLELDQKMTDMKLSHTYQTKNVSSSQESAVTASGSTSANNGTYHIEVERLATAAMNKGEVGVDLTEEIDIEDLENELNFYTSNDDGEKQSHSVDIEDGDTYKDILNKINESNAPVRAFFHGDEKSAQVVIETTRTGQYNTENEESGAEIVFDKESPFFKHLGLDPEQEAGGQDAQFTYNDGLTITSKKNEYEINGINFEFHNETDGSAAITINNDVDHAFEQIMDFVDTYNDVVEKLNETQQERKHRDYPPLTDEQKEEMTEKEIELWEGKAKSGILRGENVITNGLSQMRRSWYEKVDNDGSFSSITEIGITTSPDYLDGGKLIVDEDKLKTALRENPEDVQKLMSNATDDDSQGLINRLDHAVGTTMDKIDRHAGKATSTLDNYTLGRRMKDLDQRIESFEERLVKTEKRYWNQFTEMEKAIQRMNEQSSQLLSQFGGEMM